MWIRAQDASEAGDLQNLADVVDFNPHLDRAPFKLPLGQASYLDSKVRRVQLREGKRCKLTCKFICHCRSLSTL